MSLWYVGAMLSGLGSVASNLGVNIQKFSFMKNAKLEPDQQKVYTKQPLWALGLALVILGSLGDFAALGLAAQSIVAPIGSITLVSNVLFAHFGLKEPLSKRDIFGTFLIILGSTLSVAFGNHAEVSYTLDELKDLYIQTGFICYGFILLGTCILLYGIIKKLQPIKVEMVDKCQEYENAVAAEPKDIKLIEELDLRIAELELKYEPYEKIHPFTYCMLSGCLGAQSILFGKMLAEMIGESIRGNNQMIYPLTWVFLACMLFCIFSQLHFLALGLSFFDALYVVPVFQCFFISVSTLGGAAYFHEFSSFEVTQIVFFPIGILCTLTGVYILSSREMKKSIVRGEQPSDTNGISTADGVQTSDSNTMPISPAGIQLSDRSQSGEKYNSRIFSQVSPVNEGDELVVGTNDDNFNAPLAATTQMNSEDTLDGPSQRRDEEVVDPTARPTNGYTPSNSIPVASRPPGRLPPPIPVSSSMPHPSSGHMHINTDNSLYSPDGTMTPQTSSSLIDSSQHLTRQTRLSTVSRFAKRRSLVVDPHAFGSTMTPSVVAANGTPQIGAWNGGSGAYPTPSNANGAAPAAIPHLTANPLHSSRNSSGSISHGALTATHASTAQRKRSTWTNEQGRFNRGSVFHAGLAVLGVHAPDEP